MLKGGEAVRAIVPRELNNMAYYDKEYGGWIQKNNTYQGTYLAQKWLRPYPGEAKPSHTSIYWDKGAHPTRGTNHTHILTMSGCRNWAGAGGHPLKYASSAGGMWLGRPGHRSTIHPHHYSETSNPEVSGAGGDGNWKERSFKLNGKYGACERVAHVNRIDKSKSNVI